MHVGIIWLDDFLTPEALERVSQLCHQTTMWHEVKPMGYLGAYVDDGFTAPLLYQVVVAAD